MRRAVVIVALVVALAAGAYWYVSPGAGDDADPSDDAAADAPPENTLSSGNAAILATMRPATAAAFRQYLAARPNDVLTSGLRTTAGQAHAMASNIVSSANRQWVKQTYKATPLRDAVQGWVDSNPDAVTVADISAGLSSVLGVMSDAFLRTLSWHMTGEAGDAGPSSDPTEFQAQTDAMQAVVEQHIARGGTAKVLTQEGGLKRLHAQFSDDIAPFVA